MYQFIQQQSQDHPVELLCQSVGVSRSAYYAFMGKQTYRSAAKKEEKQAQVVAVFRQHKRGYGARRIVEELREQGHPIGREQVRSAMIANGLVAIQPRSFVPRTTDSRHTLGFSPNLLLTLPAPTGLNQVWVSDITATADRVHHAGQWELDLSDSVDGSLVASDRELACSPNNG